MVLMWADFDLVDAVEDRDGISKTAIKDSNQLECATQALSKVLLSIENLVTDEFGADNVKIAVSFQLATVNEPFMIQKIEHKGMV